MVKEWQNEMTLREWLRGAAMLVDADDARHLLLDTLDLSPTQLFLSLDEGIPTTKLSILSERMRRCAAGEPVAYIVGRRGFWSMDLEVNEHTLIPRADTETLVETALVHLRSVASPRILDLGTGSGTVALALARERPDASVLATDYSEQALQVAERNAARLQLQNVTFKHGSWFEAVGEGAFDMIVSNPPYIREKDAHLDELRFEPILALTSGPDGLQALRHICGEATAFLEPGGWLVLEHGNDQAASVQALLRTHGYLNVSTRKDYGGNDRVTFGQRGLATMGVDP